MFAFKIQLCLDKKTNMKLLVSDLKQICNNPILKCDNNKVVDSALITHPENDFKIFFGFVMKNKLSDTCHMEPRYNLKCNRCNTKPWLTFDD